MPLYEYRCGKCGQEFESYRRLSDVKGEETCPACGATAKKMGISLFARSKGSGAPGGSPCGGGPRRSPFS